MGIFSSIRDAIFGPTAAPGIGAAIGTAPGGDAGGGAAQGGWMPTTDFTTLQTAAQPVDVDSVLT